MVKARSNFLIAEICSRCVPATLCTTTSTRRLTTLLKGGRIQHVHQGQCREDSALSGTSKAGTEAETW